MMDATKAMNAMKAYFRDHSTEIIWALVFAVIFAFVAGMLFEEWKSEREVRTLRRNLKTVVQVLTFNHLHQQMNQGSGFIVRKDGAIATSLHILNNAAEIKIKLSKEVKGAPESPIDVTGLLYKDLENDVAILKMEPGKIKLDTVTIEDSPVEHISKQDKRNEEVTVISNPLGLENNVTSGVLSNIIYQGKKTTLVITAPISPGSSGGPVFNEKGNVIGIIRWTSRHGQNLNFAGPANIVKANISNKRVIPVGDSGFEDLSQTTEYWTSLGLDDMNAGLFGSAVEDFKAAIHYKKDNQYAHYMLGLAYMNLGNLKAAIRKFKEALDLKPNDERAYVSLSQAYSRTGNYMKAADSQVKAIQISGAKRLDNFLMYGQLGSIYMNTQNNGKAIKAFCRVLENAPKDEMTYQNIANALFRLGEYERAENEIRQAIRFNVNYATAYQLLGMALIEQGKYDEAIQEFSKAIKLTIDPNLQLSAHYHLGLAFLFKNEESQAFGEYKAVFDLLKDIYQQSLQSNMPNPAAFEKAIDLGKELIKKYPHSPDAAAVRNYLRICQSQLKKEFKKLIAYQDKRIELSPEDAMPYYYRGFDHMKIKEYDRAERDLKKALSIEPDNPLTNIAMAELYAVTNRTLKACDWLRTGIEKGYDDRDHIMTDEAFANIRNASCYEKILSKIGAGSTTDCNASGTPKTR